MRNTLILAALLAGIGLGFVLAGCGSDEADAGAGEQLAPDLTQERVPGVTYDSFLEPAGLGNYIRWSEQGRSMCAARG